jgi:kynureninase
MTRDEAAALDRADPLAAFRDEFVVADPELVYLDGNSLGRLPRATAARLQHAVYDEWGARLVRGWDDWIDLPVRIGDLLGEHFLGARPGEVAVSDSTTVNLYKLAAAALDHRADRGVIVTDDDNFPTDRYVLEGLAAQRGLELRLLHTHPVDGVDLASLDAALDEDVALVSLSHVAYRSGALLDLAAAGDAARRVGAMTLWDLSHSAGSVPVDLTAAGADLAVGCTYKYLNGGPGAPAFLYVRQELHTSLRQPIWGWFGQRDQFAMGPRHDPVEGIGRFLVGTPPVLGLFAVEEGVRLLAAAGIDRLRAKGMAMTSLVIDLADEWLAPLGFEVATPRDPTRRGSHVALSHPDAYRISRALLACGVVPDFRAPDRLRLGPAPVATRFVDVYDGLDRLRALTVRGDHLAIDAHPTRVT